MVNLTKRTVPCPFQMDWRNQGSSFVIISIVFGLRPLPCFEFAFLLNFELQLVQNLIEVLGVLRYGTFGRNWQLTFFEVLYRLEQLFIPNLILQQQFWHFVFWLYFFKVSSYIKLRLPLAIQPYLLNGGKVLDPFFSKLLEKFVHFAFSLCNEWGLIEFRSLAQAFRYLLIVNYETLPSDFFYCLESH